LRVDVQSTFFSPAGIGIAIDEVALLGGCTQAKRPLYVTSTDEFARPALHIVVSVTDQQCSAYGVYELLLLLLAPLYQSSPCRPGTLDNHTE